MPGACKDPGGRRAAQDSGSVAGLPDVGGMSAVGDSGGGWIVGESTWLDGPSGALGARGAEWAEHWTAGETCSFSWVSLAVTARASCAPPAQGPLLAVHQAGAHHTLIKQFLMSPTSRQM